MPFRENMKKAFGTKRSGESTPSGAQTPSPNGPGTPPQFTPTEVNMLKKRGKWDQQHQDRLLSFSFADAWNRRRSSAHTSYSPAGTKSQSRRSSWKSRKSTPRSEADDRSLRRRSEAPASVKENEEDVVNPPGSQRLADGVKENEPQPARSDLPFSPEDLERAITAVTLTPTVTIKPNTAK